MSADHSVISGCRLCRSGDLRTVIDFGMMPLANGYTRAADEPEDLYPLTLARCGECGHMQILETVRPEILFSNFLYATGDSPTLVGHFAKYAGELVELFGRRDFRVPEIASNDGVLVKALEDLGVSEIVGVEPASNLVEMARKTTRAEYHARFFGPDVAREIADSHGHFDAITANNVMAHVAELDGVMEGVVTLLGRDGIFVFENAYLLDTVASRCYDNTYHEHLQYYGIRPLVRFLARFGLEMFDIRHQETQAGSFRIFAKRAGNEAWTVRPSVEEVLRREEEAGLYEDSTYDRFREDFYDLYGKLGEIVGGIWERGESLSCYGCSAKFALLSRTLGLSGDNTRYVVDDSRLKQGLLSPGCKIPIVGRERFVEDPTDYCIISAWNLADAIAKRNPQYPGKIHTAGAPPQNPRVAVAGAFGLAKEGAAVWGGGRTLQGRSQNATLSENHGRRRSQEPEPRTKNFAMKPASTARARRRPAAGYCCSSLGGFASRFKTATIGACGKGRKERISKLKKLWRHNLGELSRILDYNMECRIRLFRMGSGMFPLADHPRYAAVWRTFMESAAADACREKIRQYLGAGGRLTLHPGPHVSLGHPSKAVRKRSAAHLEMQAATMDLLGLPRTRFAPINIHLGTGRANGKNLGRFRTSLGKLGQGVTSRLVFENEDKAYWTWQNIRKHFPDYPVTLDCHHHRINNLGDSLEEAAGETSKSWGGVVPLVHVSEGAKGELDRNHGDWVREMPGAFMRRGRARFDIEVEAKKKDLALFYLRAKYILRDP